jgi:hypothetical protein
MGGFLRHEFFAVHCQRTFAALRISGDAGIPAEQHDPMAEIGAFFRRENGTELLLYFFRLFAFGET